MNATNNQDPFDQQNIARQWERDQRRGKVLGGIFIVAIGTLFLLRELGIWLPAWLFTWQMLVIAIGLFTGLKHSFRSFGWIITVLVGLAFLIKEFAPWLHIGKFLWPVAIILVGVFMIFRPRRDACEGRMQWRQYKRGGDLSGNASNTGEDRIDFNAVFGSINKNVISKTFQGGEVNAVFGGAEINLMQSDFEGRIELEINAVFGGVRIILPPHWTVKSEIAAVIGSVEDNRPTIKDANPDAGKVLILRGNAVFGGIELQSFS
jgi:predicted membrane protein